MTNTAMAMRIETGSTRKPAPTVRNVGLRTVMIWPSVMSIAMPRPAVMSTSVAMIGWMPRTATRKPFHRPSSTQSAGALPMAVKAVPALVGSPASAIQEQVTAAAMATTAPTERSIPRVAMTGHMPRAMSIVGAPFFRMSTRLPWRWPSWKRRARNDGRTIALAASSTTIATRGHSRPLRRRRPPHARSQRPE